MGLAPGLRATGGHCSAGGGGGGGGVAEAGSGLGAGKGCEYRK